MKNSAVNRNCRFSSQSKFCKN